MKDCQKCQWNYKGTCYSEDDCNFVLSYSTFDKFLIWFGSKFVGMGIGLRRCDCTGLQHYNINIRENKFGVDRLWKRFKEEHYANNN